MLAAVLDEHLRSADKVLRRIGHRDEGHAALVASVSPFELIGLSRLDRERGGPHRLSGARSPKPPSNRARLQPPRPTSRASHACPNSFSLPQSKLPPDQQPNGESLCVSLWDRIILRFEWGQLNRIKRVLRKLFLPPGRERR